ncbi:MAG: hypothetical protein IT577_00040 [Verrucomicrobiae bacterium]|nr:hypothetical protein [Verrucomicrobiae bacterium]
MVAMRQFLSRGWWVAAALIAMSSASWADSKDVKPVEFTPIIDANGVTIGWLGEQNAEEMNIDTTERAYRLPLPGGGFTVFTVQAIPGDDTSLTGLQPVKANGPGRRHPGRDVDLRIEVKSGDPLRVLLPEGVDVFVPKDTVILVKFLVERLGKRGGALASTSNRDLFTRRIVSGFVRIETMAGGPVTGNDPGESPRPIPLGEAVVFDIRNFYLPSLFSVPQLDVDMARMTVASTVDRKEDDDDDDDDDDGPVTP